MDEGSGCLVSVRDSRHQLGIECAAQRHLPALVLRGIGQEAGGRELESPAHASRSGGGDLDQAAVGVEDAFRMGGRACAMRGWPVRALLRLAKLCRWKV